MILLDRLPVQEFIIEFKSHFNSIKYKDTRKISKSTILDTFIGYLMKNIMFLKTNILYNH